MNNARVILCGPKHKYILRLHRIQCKSEPQTMKQNEINFQSGFYLLTTIGITIKKQLGAPPSVPFRVAASERDRLI